VTWHDCSILVIGSSSSMPGLPSYANYLNLVDGLCHLDGKLIDLNTLGIVGAHNHANALMAAFMASEIKGQRPETLLPYLANFRSLSYRCEVVFKDDSRIIVNDSKSTNLESTLSALSMVRRPAVLLMGGQGKGESYLDLNKNKERLQLLIVFGASKDAIAGDAPQGVAVASFAKMRDAVLHGLQVARDNKCDLIFSPGCASFDEFKNFEHRGAVFNELVKVFNSGTV